MNLVDQLHRDEGVRLKPYKDSVGKLTIGIGRNLDDVGISLPEVYVLLQNDIATATLQLEQALPWTSTLDDARQGVLLNMTFNMGIHSLLGFHQFLGAVQSGDYLTASRLMLESHWATQVESRSYRLSVQMATGVWQ